MDDLPSQSDLEHGSDVSTRPSAWTRAGTALLVGSVLLWVLLPIVPFLPLSTGAKAAVGGGLLVAAEVAFWPVTRITLKGVGPPLPLLRITQDGSASSAFRIEIALESEGFARRTARADFSFKMTEQDQQQLRWYLEDYLQFPQDPAPKLAALVEAMLKLG